MILQSNYYLSTESLHACDVTVAILVWSYTVVILEFWLDPFVRYTNMAEFIRRHVVIIPSR